MSRKFMGRLRYIDKQKIGTDYAGITELYIDIK